LLALLNRTLIYGHLIKFSHTVFALPFALAAVLLAHRQHPVSAWILGWILVAMASARSAAMGFNRYADYEFDRRNPRTAMRPLVAGQIGKASVLLFVLISSSLFILSAAMLGRLCLLLALPTLLMLFFYSYTKRFTSFSHLVLGLAIGLAPLGAWVASTGTFDLRILPLALALMTYIAGFDILYACQDIEFDRAHRLFSLPAAWGVERALHCSSLFHVFTFIFLLSIAAVFDLGRLYLGVLLIIGLLLVLEHKLIQPERLEQVNFAFFHINSAVSLLLFLAVLLDTWMG
jgi:4-hydroxybenzoate polyprenyltransferase